MTLQRPEQEQRRDEPTKPSLGVGRGHCEAEKGRRRVPIVRDLSGVSKVKNP
jgi:hypothetical protein